jgi:hypothetical protein
MMKKMYSHRAHAKRRAMERYGILLNREAYLELRDVIRSGGGQLIIKDGKTTIWRVPYQGQELLTIYNRTTHEIVTFLPPELTDEAIIDHVKMKDMLAPARQEVESTDISEAL